MMLPHSAAAVNELVSVFPLPLPLTLHSLSLSHSLAAPTNQRWQQTDSQPGTRGEGGRLNVTGRYKQ